MQKHEHEEITLEEIKEEFQLERMILFSDAVFAIVITLMAMEMKLPEGRFESSELSIHIWHLVPNMMAYTVSFIFIGAIWYQHLRMFSLLKRYDKGLVVRNMILLFLIGLFPFSATVITRAKGSSMGFFIYMTVVMLCVAAQFFLYHYILNKRPVLHLNADLSKHREDLHNRKITLIAFCIATIVVIITYILIPDQMFKPLATLWLAFMPLLKKFQKKKRVKA